MFRGSDLLWACPMFNAGRNQCLSLVCSLWPSCHRWIPCFKNGGPPLWFRWCWIHSLALGSPWGPAVHGGVPREILWIWCEGSWQGWPTLFAACLIFLRPLWTHLLHEHRRNGHLYLSCTTSVFCLMLTRLLSVMLSAHVHQLIWCTTSRCFSPIRFLCVSLTSCTVGRHSTVVSSKKWQCRCVSLSAGERQQCWETGQCELFCYHLILFFCSLCLSYKILKPYWMCSVA